MKKQIKPIILILFLIFSLSACGKRSVENNTVNNNEQVINNEEVGVNNNQTQQEEPAEVITSDLDTSNWKTYRNEEYGFEVKYPGGYKNLNIKGIDFEGEIYDPLGIKIIKDDANLGDYQEIAVNVYYKNIIDIGDSLENSKIYKINQYESLNSLKKIKEFSSANLKNINGIKVLEQKIKNNHYFIVRNNNKDGYIVFNIQEFGGSNIETDQERMRLMSDVLSTVFFR